MVQMIEYLLSMWEILGSIISMAKKKNVAQNIHLDYLYWKDLVVPVTLKGPRCDSCVNVEADKW
jgi:hypothetical protein